MRTSYMVSVFLFLLASPFSDVSAGGPVDEGRTIVDLEETCSDSGVRRDFSSGIFLRALVRFYQSFISPQDVPVCRFSPSCSEFGDLSIGRYGPIRGTIMTLDRLQRCHPFIRSDDYPLSGDMMHFYDPPERHLLW